MDTVTSQFSSSYYYYFCCYYCPVGLAFLEKDYLLLLKRWILSPIMLLPMFKKCTNSQQQQELK